MPLLVAKKGKGKGKGKGKKERFLGPSTIAKPCLFGAGVLYVVQTAMNVFFGA